MTSPWNPDEAREWMAWLQAMPPGELFNRAEAMTLAGQGTVCTYSRKVFIPLTKLCRDVCHYCTFAQRPSQLAAPFLDLSQVLDIARAGEAAGCREALFTLGDRPEARFAVARRWLADRGYATTLEYLADAAALVLKETGLLPHLNPGLMAAQDYAVLRPLSASMGLMLESASDRLCGKGMAHFGSPDKRPAARLQSIRLAGEASVPFTTGLLIGIGETRQERIEALLAIRDLHARYGHIQEVIIQNFRAKPGTRMVGAAEPSLDDHRWTIAAARLLLGPQMTIQAPPNLRAGELSDLIGAGVNDWGGVSPVTPDHVNPEAPWPHLEKLETQTEAAGRHLRQRLAIGPGHVRDLTRWVDPALQTAIRRAVDTRGLVRETQWHAGTGDEVPDAMPSLVTGRDPKIVVALGRVEQGEELDKVQIARLFTAEGRDFDHVRSFADELRRDRVGDTITHVVNRNINYTNICLYRCGFCAFSKGSTRRERGPAYNIDHAEIARRTREAWDRGATEVCLQGGIHPSYDGNTYRGIVEAVKAAVPQMHVHAFSPLEVHHGATTLGMSYKAYLADLKAAGLATLPGTAAEILSDDVRAIICADKVDTAQWLGVMRAAHAVGLKSTATIMFGHVETYEHWAEHLLQVRTLQRETSGFTEFVPLPFVHMEAPNWRRGETRSGPTWREAVLMHAVARIALDGAIPNIQTSWVKLGPDGAAAMLQSGANDLGGTLMDESITRAAGGQNGQIFDVPQMQALAARLGRPLRQRETIYGQPIGQMAYAD
ncbi:MAG: 5-amino-6-(D-ribitylamino)uracil--L-tyrosine 4-hydroxyphenyl transferase CofH [Blastomonas sp.]|jgi:FO synthase|uniref:5-amino-6-(D-ribitylamino)uracil--L-tyrosine 4-hydroxyphenyl transferase CofH n=1 Tax=Blastomonas TaxID=150203 RepID=UPI00083E0503|nr:MULTISPECIES: 5-amino-6-(D-ribitylamino)uracil--L-tyrosine 4-hydroxyphenyl transferase CofH [unclassified Blastomonas]AOG02214.1 7,8-didemethyl-8-hydroxy-5-deazariboflavin synthase, CofG subunit [Blastomonas sp. RAC04]MCO5791973.1 5-amino-6-(D-ribitylamino)uracil--L-tyrosine 4-hydroxyphenyl transferase CofH [Blastomonas sp.]